MAGSYDKQDSVRVTARFYNSSDVLTDPSGVLCKIKKPDGSVSTYVYGTDAALVKQGTGIYYLDVDIDQVGIFIYRFEGSGGLKAASESKFTIKQSEFS